MGSIFEIMARVRHQQSHTNNENHICMVLIATEM